MKKFISLIVVALVLTALYFFVPGLSRGVPFGTNKPPVVDHFACSDYCPGPASKYTVKIYEGIITQEACDQVDGEFTSYIGWGTHYICKVK